MVLSHVAGTLASLSNAKLCVLVATVQAIVASPQSEELDLLPSSQQMRSNLSLGQDEGRCSWLPFLVLMCLA